MSENSYISSSDSSAPQTSIRSITPIPDHSLTAERSQIELTQNEMIKHLPTSDRGEQATVKHDARRTTPREKSFDPSRRRLIFGAGVVAAGATVTSIVPSLPQGVFANTSAIPSIDGAKVEEDAEQENWLSGYELVPTILVKEGHPELIELGMELNKLGVKYGVTSSSFDLFSSRLISAINGVEKEEYFKDLLGWGAKASELKSEANAIRVYKTPIENITPGQIKEEDRLKADINYLMRIIYEYIPHLVLCCGKIEIGADQGINANGDRVRLQPQSKPELMISIFHELQHSFDLGGFERVKEFLPLSTVAKYYATVYGEIDNILDTWTKMPSTNLERVKGSNKVMPLLNNTDIIMNGINCPVNQRRAYLRYVSKTYAPHLEISEEVDSDPNEEVRLLNLDYNKFVHFLFQQVKNGSPEDRARILNDPEMRMIVQNTIDEVFHYLCGPVRDADRNTLPQSDSLYRNVMVDDIYGSSNYIVELARIRVSSGGDLPTKNQSDFWNHVQHATLGES